MYRSACESVHSYIYSLARGDAGGMHVFKCVYLFITIVLVGSGGNDECMNVCRCTCTRVSPQPAVAVRYVLLLGTRLNKETGQDK